MVGAAIPVGGRPRYVAIAGGSLWVSNFDARTVTRVGAGSRSVEASDSGRSKPVGNRRRARGGLGGEPRRRHDPADLHRNESPRGRTDQGRRGARSTPASATAPSGSRTHRTTRSRGSTFAPGRWSRRSASATIPRGSRWAPEGSGWPTSRTTRSRASIQPPTVWWRRSGSGTGRFTSGPPKGRSGCRTPATARSHLIDSNTNRVVGAPVQIGRSVERLGADGDAVWATSAAEDTISRLEPAPR